MIPVIAWWNLADLGNFKEQAKMEGNSILHAFNNIYFAIFALFCFKLLIKISLALLTHFYIVQGNRKEAARIAEEIYGIAPGKMLIMGTKELSRVLSFIPWEIRF